MYWCTITMWRNECNLTEDLYHSRWKIIVTKWSKNNPVFAFENGCYEWNFHRKWNGHTSPKTNNAILIIFYVVAMCPDVYYSMSVCNASERYESFRRPNHHLVHKFIDVIYLSPIVFFSFVLLHSTCRYHFDFFAFVICGIKLSSRWSNRILTNGKCWIVFSYGELITYLQTGVNIKILCIDIHTLHWCHTLDFLYLF